MGKHEHQSWRNRNPSSKQVMQKQQATRQNSWEERSEGESEEVAQVGTDENFPLPWLLRLSRLTGHAWHRARVRVTRMHGVTLLVMPALIYASGINEVGQWQMCQSAFIKTNPPEASAGSIYS